MEPVTRLEKILSGQDITPVTREEALLKELIDSGGGGGGGESVIAWKPKVEADGRITWTRTASTTKPAEQNIKGEKGDKGDTGATGAKGDDGAKGDTGEAGYSPTVTITDIQGGHRVTITDEEHPTGQSFDVMDGSGGGGDAVLTAVLKASKTVGGIASGKEYAKNTPLETLFRDMLNPVEVPSFTNPSATISASGGTLVEEGTTASKTLTVNFNRGKIEPAYGTSGNRAGAATGYSLNGGASQTSNTFNVTVDDSNKIFAARVDYAAGEQPKNSAGENYGEPLAEGSVNTNTLTFEIVAAIWSNAANITQVAKEALISRNTKQKQFNFPAQTAENPQIFDVPASWTVTAVEMLNTLNNQWVNAIGDFDVTDETHGTIAYKRYQYNRGVATGARSIRIKWN